MILRLTNDITQLNQLPDFVDRIAREDHIMQPAKSLINLALEEAISNVIFYSGCTWIEVSTSTECDYIQIAIIDDGKAFNPCNHKDKAPEEMMTPGGLGITLVRNIMDSVEYDRESNHNILTMTKKVA